MCPRVVSGSDSRDRQVGSRWPNERDDVARWIGAILVGLAGLTVAVVGGQGQLTGIERTLAELQQILQEGDSPLLLVAAIAGSPGSQRHARPRGAV